MLAAETTHIGVGVGIGIGIERTRMGNWMDNHYGPPGFVAPGSSQDNVNGSIPIPIATPTPNRGHGPGCANKQMHRTSYLSR